jgi:hypothetical protein
MTHYNNFFCLVTILPTKSERLPQAPTVSHGHHIVVRSWGPGMGTAIIDYGLHIRAIVVRFPTGAKYFFMSAPKCPHRLWDPAGIFTHSEPKDRPLGVKRPKREADHSTHVIPKFAWDNISNSSHAFTACKGASHFYGIPTFLSCQLP